MGGESNRCFPRCTEWQTLYSLLSEKPVKIPLCKRQCPGLRSATGREGGQALSNLLVRLEVHKVTESTQYGKPARGSPQLTHGTEGELGKGGGVPCHCT